MVRHVCSARQSSMSSCGVHGMHARKKEREREVNTDDKRMLDEVGRNEEETVTEDRACFWLKEKKSSRGKA